MKWAILEENKNVENDYSYIEIFCYVYGTVKYPKKTGYTL